MREDAAESIDRKDRKVESIDRKVEDAAESIDRKVEARCGSGKARERIISSIALPGGLNSPEGPKGNLAKGLSNFATRAS